ncbi:MAG: hypothetical protein IT428_15995 [Planctomycetaceae bacterium]|nr:hypothetical protein [Planctomycetaceae bacterium]
MLILVCLAAVVKALATLLKAIAHPRREWLLKQYREAYESFLCPVCEYPIRRGPMKFLSWTRRSLRRLPILRTDGDTKDEPYTCPMCSTPLFEECTACHDTRHSLLPACVHCGSSKEIAGLEASASPGG